jgi:hypothetical protein
MKRQASARADKPTPKAARLAADKAAKAVLDADGTVISHGDVVVCTHLEDAFHISHLVQKDLHNLGGLESDLYDTRPEARSHAGVPDDAVQWMNDTAFHRTEEMAVGSRVMILSK